MNARENIKTQKRLAYEIARAMEKQYETDLTYKAKLSQIEDERRDTWEHSSYEIKLLKESLQDCQAEIAPVQPVVKHQAVSDGWKRWKAISDKIVASKFWKLYPSTVNGIKYQSNHPQFQIARKLSDFARQEMGHFNTAYHAGQVCKLP